MSFVFNFSILLHVRDFWKKITQPTSRREDDARREYILSVLLVLLSALSILFSVSVASLATILGTSHRGIPIWVSILISCLFIALLYIAKKGFWKFSSYAFLGLLIIPTLYSLTRWGTLLPIPLLTLSLIIVLTGILLHTQASLIMAVAIGSYLGLLNYAHQHSLISVDTSWMQRELYANYSMEITVVLLVISGVTWLAYREIDNSLRRARRSEALVKKERDTLEERVITRTLELERTQMERAKETSRLVEIGKLSAGLMHDLINPLTAVTIQIDQLNKSNVGGTMGMRDQINLALSATNRLSQMVNRIRYELSDRKEPESITIEDVIRLAIDAVHHTANASNTVLDFNNSTQLTIMANPSRLHRALVNILINAIEACAENPSTREREVHISFCAQEQKYVLIITDTGCGIEPQVLPHIFDPFFSTKSERGIGLGLHIAQELLRQELNAHISVTSELMKGTSFNISWPKN